MSGVCFMRILPTTCVHMWTVASVSCHSSRMSSGQLLLGMARTLQKNQPQINTDCHRYELLSVQICVHLWLVFELHVCSVLDSLYVDTTTHANHAAPLSTFHRWTIRRCRIRQDFRDAQSCDGRNVR